MSLQTQGFFPLCVQIQNKRSSLPCWGSTVKSLEVFASNLPPYLPTQVETRIEVGSSKAKIDGASDSSKELEVWSTCLVQVQYMYL